MKLAPNAVAGQEIGNVVAMRIGNSAAENCLNQLCDAGKVELAPVIVLDGSTDIGHRLAGDTGANSSLHSRFRRFHQTLCGWRYVSNGETGAAIAVEAVFVNCNVNVEHVSFLESLLVRDAMANYIINGGANRFRESAAVLIRVAQRRGVCAGVHDSFVYPRINLIC